MLRGMKIGTHTAKQMRQRMISLRGIGLSCAHCGNRRNDRLRCNNLSTSNPHAEMFRIGHGIGDLQCLKCLQETSIDIAAVLSKGIRLLCLA